MAPQSFGSVLALFPRRHDHRSGNAIHYAREPATVTRPKCLRFVTSNEANDREIARSNVSLRLDEVADVFRDWVGCGVEGEVAAVYDVHFRFWDIAFVRIRFGRIE